MKKAICYARVSTIDKQDTERQFAEINAYAEKQSLDVVEQFEDKITGTTKAQLREGYSSMIDYLNDHNDVKTVIIYELSRLARKSRDIQNSIEYFNDNNICVHIITNPSLVTLDKNNNIEPISSLIINLMGSFAQMEHMQIIERVSSGVKNNLRKGNSHGVTNYGYLADEHKRLIINTEESEVIKKIFNLAEKGIGTGMIADQLNTEGVPTSYQKRRKSKTYKTRYNATKNIDNVKWRSGTIYGILTNTIYIGKKRISYKSGEKQKIGVDKKGKDIYDYKMNNEIVESPQIIEERQFLAIQTLFKSNNNKIGISSKYHNFFSRKIKCTSCDNYYFLHRRADKSDNAYKCLSKRNPPKCKNFSVNIDTLNNAVYYLTHNHLFLSSWNNPETRLSTLTDIDHEIEMLNNSIHQNKLKGDELNKILKNLVKMTESSNLEDNELLKIFEERYNSISKEKNAIANSTEKYLLKIAQLKSKKASLLNYQMVNVDSLSVFQEFINEYIESIEIYNVPESLNTIFTNRQSYQVLVKLIFLGDTIKYFVVASRYSKIMVLDIQDENHAVDEVLSRLRRINDGVETDVSALIDIPNKINLEDKDIFPL